MDYSELLTEWEHGFIDSLSQLPDEQALSEKQNGILNRISEKVGARGQ